MAGRLTEQELDAWRGFLTAHAAVIGAIERDLAAAGVIPLTWYDVLIELYEAPDRRMRLHALADAIVLSRSGLSRLVDRLERAGMITREAAVADRRGAYAALTEAGVAAMRRAWPVYARGITRFFAASLSEAEAGTLTAAFARIRAAARRTGGDGAENTPPG